MLDPKKQPAVTDNRREILADFLDQRVVLTGVFDRMTINKNPHKPFKVALLQDVEVELASAKYDLGHVWIQHAESLAHFSHGDRIKCSCRVGRYRKTLPAGENGLTERIDYSLSWPSDAKLLGRPVAMSIPPPEAAPSAAPAVAPAPPVPPAAPKPAPEEPAKAADPLLFILKVKEMVEKAGGAEGVLAFKEAIDKIGGWERAVEVQRLAGEVGGWERLQQLLSLIKI